MSGLQQNVVVKKGTAMDSGLRFMGLPVFASEYFCTIRLSKYHKRFKNKRLRKKWLHRYGGHWEPREDADIHGNFILCHPSVLWRFEMKTFIDNMPENPEEDHDIHL